MGEEVRLLKCIGCETRYNILLMLKGGEKCVCEILEEINEEQSLVSHHLKSLRECGLVQKRRDGRKIMYRLADDSIVEFLLEVEEISKKFC